MNTFKERRDARQRPLLGFSLSSYDPAFVDVVARVGGYDIIWIEMEHSGMTMRETENLCRIIDGNGLLSMVRLPGVEREAVLKAAETGASILMAPMTNSVESVQRFVKHARYSPKGSRGYFGSSRAMNYGIGAAPAELRQAANERLTLWAQIETTEALGCMDDLCQVEGIDGIFMGPGDLSAEFGVPGLTDHPTILEAVARGPECARRHRRHCGTVCSAEKAGYWAKLGMDALFVGSNVGLQVKGAAGMRCQIEEQFSTGL